MNRKERMAQLRREINQIRDERRGLLNHQRHAHRELIELQEDERIEKGAEPEKDITKAVKKKEGGD